MVVEARDPNLLGDELIKSIGRRLGAFFAICILSGTWLSVPAGADGSAWGYRTLMASGSQQLSVAACSPEGTCVSAGSDSYGAGVTEVSLDGGSTWSVPSIVTGVGTFKGASCLAGSTCMLWGTSKSGTAMLLLSSKPAVGWSAMPVPAHVNSIVGMACENVLTCALIGWIDGQKTLLITTDGGTHWNAVVPVGLTKIKGGSSYSMGCSVVGGNSQSAGAAASVDASGVIHPADVPQSLLTLKAVSCAAPGFCMARGGATTAISTDGGNTWTSTSNASVSDYPFKFQCVGINRCLSLSNSGLRMTFDGGSTWQPIVSNPQVTGLSDLACAGDTSCIATGATPIFGVPSQSSIWGLITVAAPLSHVTGLSCPTSTTCLGVGGGAGIGSIVETIDSGRSWWASSSPAAADFIAVSCPSSTSCFALGFNDSGPVLSRWDGTAATTWSAVPAPANLTHPSTISCTSTSACIVGGKIGTAPAVATTADSGAHWIESQLPFSGSLSGSSCAATTVCVVVGSSLTSRGKIYRSADQGQNWTAVAIPTSTGPLSSVACEVDLRCETVGQDAAYSSTDNGLSWQSQLLPTAGEHLLAVACSTTRGCFATGWDPAGATILNLPAAASHWVSSLPPGGLRFVQAVACPAPTVCLALTKVPGATAVLRG